MRILQMTHQGDQGGATNSITWLTRGLAERGHEVYLACRPESRIAARFASGPARVVEARLPRGLALLAEARRWRRWIASRGIEVVNAHASLDRHLVSYLRLLGTSAVLLHTRRNVALSTGGRLRARFDTATTDGIIAVSRGVAADLVRRGVPERHVTVVHNGLPLSRLKPPAPERVARLRADLGLRPGVPVVGVIARRKSQGDLLRAACQLDRPLEILMAGIEEDDELRGLSRTLPEGTRARCLGYRDDVAEISALLDFFVLPSEIEGFSLALLEAMARGLPCLATDVGGNREALEDGSGILFPPGDPTALAKALARLLEEPDSSRALGARARARALREFDVSGTIDGTETLYARLRSEGPR